jgi:hypothetical protein
MSHYHATVPSQINDALTTPLSVTSTSEDLDTELSSKINASSAPSANEGHAGEGQG